MGNKLYIVIPCYNEQEVLFETTKQMSEKINNLILQNKIDKESKVLFVDDGSKDKTWELIEQYSKEIPCIEGVKLSCNKGHQNALLSGLMTAKERCDMTISIDADLQDDINAIDKMVDEYHGGSDVVYGVRSSRKKDTFFKRTTAQGYYKFMKALGVNLVYNHADFRLMSKRALDGLEQFSEVNLFLRGIVPLVGYRYSIVTYERLPRFAGTSKYPLKKMIAFALDGITSFSVKPIRLITTIGGIMLILSLAALIYCLCIKLFCKADIGWASFACSLWMIGGIQLLSLGIIGEYVGKIYFETKNRPKYIIEKDTLK